MSPFWKGADNRSLRMATGMAALACLAALGVWLFQDSGHPSARVTVLRTQQWEQEVFSKPVHLAYEVAIVQLSPSPQREDSELEIWADSGTDRFASRWHKPEGELKFGIWRRNAQELVTYVKADEELAPPPDSRVVPITSIALDGFDSLQIERGFIRWLKNRRWQPATFVSDALVLMDEEDVAIRAERMVCADGTPGLRVVARRGDAHVTAEITIEVEEASYRPRVQRIRFTTSERAVELRLATKHLESLRPAELVAAVFEPDPRADVSKDPYSRPAVPVIPMAATPTAEERASEEIAVVYALHRSGLCLSERVELVLSPSGWPEVRGIVQTEQQRRSLLGELAKAPFPLSSHIKTFSKVQTEEPHKPIAKDGAAPVAQGTTVHDGVLPAEGLVRDHLKRTFPSASPTEIDVGLGQFVADILTLSDIELQESRAFYHLSHRYESSWRTALPLEARNRLETVLRDHVQSLRQTHAEVQAHLLAILPSPTGSVPRPSKEGSLRDLQIGASSDAASMRSVSERIHSLVKSRYQEVDDLYSVRSSSGTPSARAEAKALEAASMLVEKDLGQLEDILTKEF